MKNVFYVLMALMLLSCNSASDTLVGIWEVDNTGNYVIFTEKGYYYNCYDSDLMKFSVDDNALYWDGVKTFDIKIENKNLLKLENEYGISTLTRIENRPFWGKWIIKHTTINGEDYYEYDNEIWTFSFDGFYTQTNREEKGYEYDSKKEVLNLSGEYFKIEKCTKNNLVLTCNVPGFSGMQKIKIDLEKAVDTDSDESLYTMKDAMEFVNRIGESKTKGNWKNKVSVAERATADSIRIADSLANVDARTSATILE